MSIRKYAAVPYNASDLLIVGQNQRVAYKLADSDEDAPFEQLLRSGATKGRAAHPARWPDVQFEPGYLYTAVRAISSRVNANFDGWPPEELEKSWHTFVGRPIFVEHQNWDPANTRGVNIAAKFHKDRLGKRDDWWVELLHEVDVSSYPRLGSGILKNEVIATSMGCDAERSVCSSCGNEAHDIRSFCEHIPHKKGHRIGGKLVFESCYDICFFEDSYVFDPADESALVADHYSHESKVAAKVRDVDESVLEWTKRVASLTKQNLRVASRTVHTVTADFVADEPEESEEPELYFKCPECKQLVSGQDLIEGQSSEDSLECPHCGQMSEDAAWDKNYQENSPGDKLVTKPEPEKKQEQELVTARVAAILIDGTYDDVYNRELRVVEYEHKGDVYYEIVTGKPLSDEAVVDTLDDHPVCTMPYDQFLVMVRMQDVDMSEFEQSYHNSMRNLRQATDVISLPDDVDTLRDELICPTCGTEVGDLEECPNCGESIVPEDFADPDTTPRGEAKERLDRVLDEYGTLPNHRMPVDDYVDYQPELEQDAEEQTEAVEDQQKEDQDEDEERQEKQQDEAQPDAEPGAEQPEGQPTDDQSSQQPRNEDDEEDDDDEDGKTQTVDRNPDLLKQQINKVLGPSRDKRKDLPTRKIGPR